MVRHPIVVIHDVSSAQRLLDVAHVVYGLGFDVLVASKVYGAAASSAVPDATRMALRLGKSFHVLPGVRDAVEIFKPSRIVVLSKEYGEPRSLEEIVGMLRGNTMLVLGGIDAAPSRDVAALGDAVYPDLASQRLGPAAEAALLLYTLAKSG